MDPTVTELMSAWRQGDTNARDRLFGVLHPEMRRLAGQFFRRERADHTLQPTALVNEAWLRLSDSSAISCADRGHLMAMVARLMREILVDHARARATAKRDGGERVNLTDLGLAYQAADVDLVDLDAALERLEEIDPLKVRIIELRYFVGMTIEDTGAALDLSVATVKRHWQAARIWLFDRMGGEPSRT